MAFLLKSQRNDIFNSIRICGLNHKDFDWSEGDFTDADGQFDVLTYKDSDYYFQFKIYDKSFSWSYSPGTSLLDVSGGGTIIEDWNDMHEAAEIWMESIKKDINEPDLWANLPETSDSLWQSTVSEYENSRFTNDEHTIIVQGVQKIREFVIEFGIANNEIKLLDNKLDYLVESSKKLGRKDWILVAWGTLLSVITSLALDSNSAKTIFEIAGKAFNDLYQGMLLLPQ